MTLTRQVAEQIKKCEKYSVSPETPNTLSFTPHTRLPPLINFRNSSLNVSKTKSTKINIESNAMKLPAINKIEPPSSQKFKALTKMS